MKVYVYNVLMSDNCMSTVFSTDPNFDTLAAEDSDELYDKQDVLLVEKNYGGLTLPEGFDTEAAGFNLQTYEQFKGE